MSFHESAAAEPTVARRAAILDAALAAFTEHGVAGASIEDIRRRSGASVGSIYHHFGGKDGIAGALYLEALGDYQRGFLAALAGADSARGGVEEAVRHTVSWMAAHRDLARFLLLGRDARVVVATERPLRELNRRFFAEVTKWMRPHKRRGELRELEPEVLTALWIGPSLELARLWLSGRARSSLPEAAPVLAGAAWAALKRQQED
jgi:AcrR family transcriptional regulator